MHSGHDTNCNVSSCDVVHFILLVCVCVSRFTLLKNVPFLRFLTDEEKAAIINNERACQVCMLTTDYTLLPHVPTRDERKRRGAAPYIAIASVEMAEVSCRCLFLSSSPPSSLVVFVV